MSKKPYSGRSSDTGKFNKKGASDRPYSGERKTYKRAEGEDRPKRSFDKDKTERNFDRPKRSFGDDKPKRSFGEDRPKRAFDKDKTERNFDRPKRSFGEDKPKRSFGEDRPKRAFDKDKTERNFDRPKRSFGEDKPKRSFGEDRPKRTFDKDKTERNFDRPKRSFGEDKPKRSFGEDRPKRAFDKDKTERDFDRPKRSFGEDKPKRSFGEDRAKRTFGEDRPKRSFDKDKGERSFDKPKREFGEDKPRRSFGDKSRPTLSKPEQEGDFSQAYPLGARKVSGPFRKQFEKEKKEGFQGKKPFKKEEKQEIKEMTLNKYIAYSGTCSRREAAEMVKQGKVKINGELALDPGYRVQPYDIITIAGKKLTPQKNRTYILLNKPKGYLTTTEDPEGRKTVMELVEDVDNADRLYPVGRLDRNTTGLLLLTNDGDLAQKLSHPSYEIKKVYQVSLNKPLTKADFEKIVNGIELEDGPVTVDALSYLETKDELGIEIHSGRNRIVRRIFEHLGYEVEKLDRVMYAGLTKKNIPRGKWRKLEEKEVILLKHFKS